jgi:hypothetical protein
MTIDENLIESLLYEEESDTLDLKKYQYRFTKANDDEKGELLKDILTFSNAWRRTDAFILIGVEDVKGGRGNVLGISDLLDDAPIQQFVNSKTNRPLVFSYRNLPFDGKTIAVIHIPVQQRPIYLKKDYGKLKGETVYVRRGSSTAVAGIDEISKMGVQPQLEQGEPKLEVCFAEPKTRTALPGEKLIKCLVLETPSTSVIPDYTRANRHSLNIGFSYANRSYYRELVTYTKVSRLVSPLYVAVQNSGTATAHDVRLEMRIDKSDGNVVVMDSYEYPELPRRECNTVGLPTRTITQARVRYGVEVSDVGDSWVVEARADKVQPKATCWFGDPFYVGSLDSREVMIAITLFSDQLQIPSQQMLAVNVQAEYRRVDLEGILKLECERFRASPEFQRLMQMRDKKQEGQ